MSSHTSKSNAHVSAFKDILSSHGLEDEFLKMTGLDSINELDPKNFGELEPSMAPTVVKPATSAAPVQPRALSKSTADATTGMKPSVASDMLYPYTGLHVNYRSRKILSGFTPSSLMMDYVIHCINSRLMDNHYFLRACPDYHPYILRLYYGVLFWVQCLRAGHDVRFLDYEQNQFLSSFLEAFPPETLTISSPLLTIFKTLCSSQPEIPTYGKVFPVAPIIPGPGRRDAFMLEDRPCHTMPNIPGILALLEDLYGKLTADPPVIPDKGKHIPVPANRNAAIVFGHHTFPPSATMTNLDCWALASSGLQYPCEATRKLHESYAERYENFGFPTLAADDDLTSTISFLSMQTQMAWFAQVREVAAVEASFFEGSGTLADCSPTGITANQLIVHYQTPAAVPTRPTRSCDPAALFPFSIKLFTTARSPPEMAEAMAATAQTNVRMFTTHPWLSTIGQNTLTGPFWHIRPIESSHADENSYLSLQSIVRRLMKARV